MPKTPVKYPETVSASVRAGTKARIQAMCSPGQTVGQKTRELLEAALEAYETPTCPGYERNDDYPQGVEICHHCDVAKFDHS